MTVMCGDDSNPYTRLPVLLSRQLGIPTLDFITARWTAVFSSKNCPPTFILPKAKWKGIIW